MNEIQLPENFKNVIRDFVTDLSTTFPEHSHMWQKWADPNIPEEVLIQLFDYLIKIFPERFFDILYQNEDMFKPDSEINTCFLPDVDFKILFNCENISKNTQQTMWKYLQLLLFTIVNSVKNKSLFGESMNIFEGIDEKELQSKLAETMSSMSDFFSGMTDNNDDSEETPEGEDDAQKMADEFQKTAEKMFENIPGMDAKDAFKNMPNPEDLHNHLKGLFDGKIGQLAKEMAEEMTEDITKMFGDDTGDIKSSQDVLKKLMRNPKKMMDLVKTVGNKLNTKMQSGDISQDEIMKEASDLIGKMKEMGGGGKEFNEMFKNLAKQMGGMGGLGKNSRVDTNAMSNMLRKQSFREKARERYEKKKQMEAVLQMNKASQEPAFMLEQSESNSFVFKSNEKQEKSQIQHAFTSMDKYDIDAIANELDITPDTGKTSSQQKSKSDKKKKSKSKK